MWKFIKSATNQSNYLYDHAQEVCFIGRSNVGKSTLINSLANSKIAKTSNTPGRTRLINFFNEDNKVFVDLPGYGYARIARKEQDKMLSMIEEYLHQRQELKRVFVLVDSKIGPTKDDSLILEFLKNNNISFFVIVTKSDKANQSQIHKTKKALEKITHDYLIVSSLKGKNINKLRKIIYATFK